MVLRSPMSVLEIILLMTGCLLLTLCIWCLKWRNKPRTAMEATIVPSSNTSTPYPTQPAITPMPQTAYSHRQHTSAPHIQQGFVHTYPSPQEASVARMQEDPPSYDEATRMFTRQSPYNHNFN